MTLSTRVALATAAFLLSVSLVGQPAAPAAEAETVLFACTVPLVFGFGSWEKERKAFAVGPSGIRLTAADGRGGVGWAGLQADAGNRGEWSPALRLTAGDGNQAAAINLHLGDADGTSHSYRFDLSPLAAGDPGVRLLTPEYGAALAEPGKAEKPGETPGLDLAKLSLVMLIGDWSGKAVDVTLASIVLVPPDDALRAGRAQLRELKAKEAATARLEAEAREKARRDLLAEGAGHRATGLQVTHVCATAPDVVSVTVQAGRHVNNRLVPYVPEPGDEIVEEAKDAPRHTVRDGRVVDYCQKGLFRKVGGARTRVGLVSEDGRWLFVEGATAGDLLDETVVDEPEAYAVTSPDDPAYAAPVRPAAVFRKGKPNGFSRPLPFLYTLSLRLPTPLKEGATYALRFVGVNTAAETVTYGHRPREVRSLAIHAIQTGYRPDDPHKRAYVSFWMGVDKGGQSGSCTPAVETFELVDGAGRTVFTGKAELAKADRATEQISVHETLDYTKAAVYRLDFSRFTVPGEYRVHVPGIGVSGPFRLAADAWEVPFRAAMQGILAQRQGIDLGPPACGFTRRRTFHPDDGVQFYALDMLCQEGQEGARGERFIRQSQTGPLQTLKVVPGGYQDAGDWDTIGHHLSATYDLLGLCLLNPAAVARTRLVLPGEESRNGLPDIVDEALWQMPMWRSLQAADGGVRGGYGDGWGCYAGETSSMLTYAGVYAVDHETTLRYAAAAARAARVLEAFDQAQAATYLESARRAWRWVEAHSTDADPTYARLSARQDWPPVATALANARARAAVELLAATREPAYDQAFRQSSELSRDGGLYLEQPDADFAYARLPEALGDAALKQRAVARITAYADHAIEFSRKNAFGLITGHRTDMPMIFVSRFFSTPGAGGFALIYAYELTGKPAYLAAAVQGANYSLGANPDNLSYCAGVGWAPERFPFFVDVQVSGQYPDVPVGHIPYGQGNEGNEMSRGANGWVQQWLLNYGPAKKMVPNWYEWPVTEQYVDFGRYPLHNETCFNQTTVPAACYWFWLATRPAAGGQEE